jgi:hypothetical protein
MDHLNGKRAYTKTSNSAIDHFRKNMLQIRARIGCIEPISTSFFTTRTIAEKGTILLYDEYAIGIIQKIPNCI